MEEIYEKIKLPNKVKLNVEIAIEKFISSDNINDEYRQIFKDNVKKVILKYCLKSDVLNIKSKKINDMNYSEIEVFEIEIGNPISVYDIASVIGKTIPYPAVIFFIIDNKFKIGIYKIRENKLDIYKSVISDIVFTGWFNRCNLQGRIIKILEDLDIDKLKYEDIYGLYQKFYNVILKYHSSYISIDEIKGLYKKYGVNLDNQLMNSLIENCNYIYGDDEKYNSIEWMKNHSKLEKYKRNNNIIMVCKDEFWNFAIKSKFSKFKDFDDFDRAFKKYKFILEQKKIEDLAKNRTNCIYYDGRICNNMRSLHYNKFCKDARQCLFYKRSKITNIRKYDDIKYEILNYSNKENEFNNTNEEIAEYGDIIEVFDVEENAIKKYAIVRLGDGKIPFIPSACLNNKINYTFTNKNKKYILKKIIKSKISKQDSENETKIINVEQNSTKIGDIIDLLNIKTNDKIEYEVKNDLTKKFDLMFWMTVNKKIGHKFNIHGNTYKIVGINTFNNKKSKESTCIVNKETDNDNNKEKIKCNEKLELSEINNKENLKIEQEIVEYGDVIEIQSLKTNEVKKYAVFKVGNQVLNYFCNVCLDKKIGFNFKYNNNEYKLVNILKNKNGELL